ncbi:MAG: transglycosylase SLT domain-containing protein, partial [Treponemataceae bacterium]
MGWNLFWRKVMIYKKKLLTLFFCIWGIQLFANEISFTDEDILFEKDELNDYNSASYINSLLIPVFENMLLHEQEIKILKEKMTNNNDPPNTQEDDDPIIYVMQPAQTIPLIKDEKVRPAFIPLDLYVPQNNKRVKDFRNQYLGNFGKQWTYTVMERGLPYRKYIQRKIAEYDMPQCMEFLPIIESMFRNDALSKSGALGMWQFMKNSISEYNIRANDWIDERRDPWLTTDAALKKLLANKRALGDWYLALAAYNAGLGRIRGAIKKGGGKADYWYLSEKKLIPTETINYVPKFLAIAEIITNAEYYDVLIPTSEKEDFYSMIEVNYPIDIKLLAQKMELEESVLKFLNPALNYNITPPSTRYQLRVPKGTAEKAKQIIREHKNQLLNNLVYTVRSGDTLYVIAQHYNIPLAMIEKANPELKP